MSNNWAKGSTTRWRKTRRLVIARDGARCQLRLPGCTTIATQVHHTLGRHVTGDNPTHLVAACRNCNLRIGDPTRRHDPQPRRMTRW